MKNKNVSSKKKGPRILIILLIAIIMLIGAIAGLTYLGKKAAGDLVSWTFSEPLDGATSAKVTINPDDGNLTVEKNTSSEQMLARGTLEYFEHNGAPLSSVTASNGITEFTVNASGGQPWLKLPWAACNGGTDWLIQLNPSVSYDITALTGGGNVKIDLTGLTVTRLAAETGGGNMEVTLPDKAENLDVFAKTGAGKVTLNVGNLTGNNTINASSGAGEVTVVLPKGAAARIKVSQGNVIVDPGFTKINDTTYETPGYQNAVDKVDITVGSGAGKVNINIK